MSAWELAGRLHEAEAALARVRALLDETVWIAASEVEETEEFVYADELRQALEGPQ